MPTAVEKICYPLGCPRCHHRFGLPISSLKEGCGIRCPRCGAALKISNYQRWLIRRQVEKAIANKGVRNALN